MKDRGFTLLETMIATLVLLVGILGLAMLLGSSLAFLNGSQADLIAQQKAAEAVECIFTARDMQALTWAQIQNTGQRWTLPGGSAAHARSWNGRTRRHSSGLSRESIHIDYAGKTGSSAPRTT